MANPLLGEIHFFGENPYLAPLSPTNNNLGTKLSYKFTFIPAPDMGRGGREGGEEGYSSDAQVQMPRLT